MRLSLVRFSLALTLMGLGGNLQSCQGGQPVNPHLATGTETNWLQACSRDQECGTLSCECGVCTQRCSEEEACHLPGAVCSPTSGAALDALCATASRESALCLPACSETCGAGQICLGGACIPAADAGSPAESSRGADSSSRASSGGSGLTASPSDTADGSNTSLDSRGAGDASFDSGLAFTTADVTNADAFTDASSSAGEDTLLDAGAGCSLAPDQVSSNCCYGDKDCAGGEGCYQAACSGEVGTPGRCATPPPAPNCYSARDCDPGEVCQGGLLAACGTPRADSLGTCVPDCGYDSCHPERCDEIGETCCDPLPGDGPNYCNSGLECLNAVCVEQANTTTPEALERQSCEDTGGEWMATSCGHYVCGQPPACAAVIPGCNCGPGRSFGSMGCWDQPDCPAP